MDRPKVVVFSPVYPPRKGGAATYFSTLTGLLSDRVDFTVVCLHSKGLPADDEVDGIRVLRALPEKYFSNRLDRYMSVVPKAFSVLSRCKKEGAQVLHAHSNGIYGYSASLFSAFNKVPMLKEVQDTSDPPFVLKAGHVHKWVATGRFVEKKLMDMGVDKGRILTFPALNPPSLKLIAGSLKEQRPGKEGEVRFLFVGWLVNRIKGVDLLIDAFRDAYTARGGMELIIIGDGPDRRMLEAKAKGLPVRFLGERPYEEVVSWMASSDILVLPSHEEANPRVILEGYEVGLPAIATNVGGVGEEVIEGVTGLLVGPNDIGLLRQAMLRLASDAKMRQDLGKGGKEFLRKLPTWTELSDAIYRSYLEMA